MNPFIVRSMNRALMFAALAGIGQLSHAGQPLICLIQPSKIAEIGTSVYGVIEHIHVERGDLVKKGQVIATLRNDVERAALDVAKSKAQAEADVQAAQANVEYTRQRLARSDDLVKKKFISEQGLDQSRVEFQVAEQKLAQAREQRRIWEREMTLAQSQLSQRTLVSPIDGIVAERYLSTGERVENRSVARVVTISPLHVEVMVPAAQFGKIKTGMTANVIPELPDAPSVEGKVSLVDKLIDGASNTFRVRLEVPNKDHAIPAGPRCKVAFGDQVIGGDSRAGKSGAPLTLAPAVPPAVTTTAVPPAVTASAAPARPPAPSAAVPPPSAPKAAPAPGIEVSVLGAVERWRKAWADKDLAGYLAAYTPDYRGESLSPEAWIKQRQARITRPGKLDIDISDTQILPVAENKLRVNFRQKYQADGYRDDTLKSLLMILDKGKWLILEERVVR